MGKTDRSLCTKGTNSLSKQPWAEVREPGTHSLPETPGDQTQPPQPGVGHSRTQNSASSKYMLYAWKLLHRTLLFNYTALNIRFLIWSWINSVNTAPVITPPHWREFHLPILYTQSQLKFSRNKSQALSITTYTELIHFQFVVPKIRMYEILIKGNNNQTKQKNRKKFF